MYGPCPDVNPSSLRAELWAVIQILTLAVPPLTVWVDNKTVVDGWAKGPEWCCRSARPAADLWREFWRRIDDIGAEGLHFKKCKGHASEGDVQAGRSTPFLRRGNDNADHFAGRGVDIALHQVPNHQAIESYKEALSWYRWLAVLVEHWPNDVQQRPKLCPLDSSQGPREARKTPRARGVSSLPGGEMVPFALHPERPHSLQLALGRLACQHCTRYISQGCPQSLQNLFARSECLGSIASRVRQAAGVDSDNQQGGRQFGSAHVLLQTGALVWCRRCGLYAEQRMKGLLLPCRGLEGAHHYQLKMLMQGCHPKTSERLGGEAVLARS